MRFATRREIEYLSSIDGKVAADSELINEMSRQLDALRRYDQNFYNADWRPRHSRSRGRSKRNEPKA